VRIKFSSEECRMQNDEVCSCRAGSHN
jgi:hypothetical protein